MKGGNSMAEEKTENSKQNEQEINTFIKEMFGEAAEMVNDFASDVADLIDEGSNEESSEELSTDSNETIEQENDKAYQELLDRYQRSLAEFDNFRKRTLKEKAGAYDSGVQDTVEKLLPIIDNFERALAASEDKEDTFYQGIAMISRQLTGCLADLGVETIGGRGVAFDPNLHYAVAHVEDPEYGANEVIDELQKGYTYKGKVIRPSMVRVAN